LLAVHLELFYSPYCPRCRRACRQLRALATAWPSEQLQLSELDVVQELDRAVALGVQRTPSLAIDGELLAGPVPAPGALDALVRQRLNDRQPP